MMGRTHALGGVAAFAAASLAMSPGDPFLPGFVLAAASALVPDADNDRGSLMNRPYLLPLKAATVPLWMGASHRGRTHSLLGTAVYVAMIVAWAFGIRAATLSLWSDAPEIPLVAIALAAGAGYLSHLLLDLFNLIGMSLLWPLPGKFVLPIWPAHGLIPGRFAAGSRWERWLAWPLLAAFVGWYGIETARLIVG